MTPRQRQILEYLSRGWGQQATARQLGVTAKTVYRALDGAFETLGARPWPAAVAVFLRAEEAVVAVEPALELVPEPVVWRPRSVFEMSAAELGRAS